MLSTVFLFHRISFCPISCSLQQAQVYYAGKSRYIGVFQNREEACYAYEIGREILKTNKEPEDNEVEVNMNLARRAAFYGVQKMRE